MKLHYGIIMLALFAFVVLWPVQQARAVENDTLVVEWESSPGTYIPIKNALWVAIKGDTGATSTERKNANRVYLLKKGGFYWLEETIANDGWALRIVGEPSGNAVGENPPVVQMVARTSDGSVSGRIITGGGDLTLKNLWITGRDDNGAQNYYEPIRFDGSNKKVIIDNCVFEQSNFSITAFYGTGNVLYFTNNKYRNLVGLPSTQQWEGRGISVWADQDSIIVENNTFFNVEFTAFQMEGGAGKYVRFNHNTMVNVGRNFITGGWWREAYFANNLIVNGFWQAENPTDYNASGRDPRAYFSGFWGITSQPAKFGPEEGRRIFFGKSAAWLDPYFTGKYGDTIRTQYFVGPVTKLDFLNKLNDNSEKAYPQMVARDTTWLSARPNFATYPDAAMLDSMWKNITMIRAAQTPAANYWYMPTANPTDVSWPLPENFAYTTPTEILTAGSDGLPLGDLNWFPTQKATFEANKAVYVRGVEDLPGNRIIYEPVSTIEAETGVVGGTAAVENFAGFSYFKMDGGGWIQWDFNLASAGQYDLNVWTHLRGNGTRGQRIIVNGVSIHDPMGWGEYIWSPTEQAANIWYGKIGNNEWVWTLIKQAEINEAGALTLPTGANRIRIESSWGYQNFAGVDVIPNGTSTPTVQLRAPDATSDIVTPMAEGAPWVPSKFKAVNLGANGSVAVTYNVAEAGNYKLSVAFQNYGDPQTAQVQVTGGATVTAPLAAKTDSTGQSVLSGTFSLGAGSQTITVSSSNVKLDILQLNKETIITGVDGTLLQPNVFSLDQNYPNPFNPTTTINFTLGKTSNVKLAVYNILGQKVATLVDSKMDAGPQSIVFDASRYASGVYFYRLDAGNDFNQVKKMLLIK